MPIKPPVAIQERIIDLDSLRVELAALVREERELSEVRRKLHERIDAGFANEVTIARERQVSDERLALHRRIDTLRGQLDLHA
jgi:hypothetical protein